MRKVLKIIGISALSIVLALLCCFSCYSVIAPLPSSASASTFQVSPSIPDDPLGGGAYSSTLPLNYEFFYDLDIELGELGIDGGNGLLFAYSFYFDNDYELFDGIMAGDFYIASCIDFLLNAYGNSSQIKFVDALVFLEGSFTTGSTWYSPVMLSCRVFDYFSIGNDYYIPFNIIKPYQCSLDGEQFEIEYVDNILIYIVYEKLEEDVLYPEFEDMINTFPTLVLNSIDNIGTDILTAFNFNQNVSVDVDMLTRVKNFGKTLGAYQGESDGYNYNLNRFLNGLTDFVSMPNSAIDNSMVSYLPYRDYLYTLPSGISLVLAFGIEYGRAFTDSWLVGQNLAFEDSQSIFSGVGTGNFDINTYGSFFISLGVMQGVDCGFRDGYKYYTSYFLENGFMPYTDMPSSHIDAAISRFGHLKTFLFTFDSGNKVWDRFVEAFTFNYSDNWYKGYSQAKDEVTTYMINNGSLDVDLNNLWLSGKSFGFSDGQNLGYSAHINYFIENKIELPVLLTDSEIDTSYSKLSFTRDFLNSVGNGLWAEFWDGYQFGFRIGWDTSYSLACDTIESIYWHGYNTGYDTGYYDGFIAGGGSMGGAVSSSVGIISLMAQVIAPIFTLEIFPGFTIGLFVLTFMLLTVLFFVLRLGKGGA